MDVSSASSFYEPPVKYDEGKTIELYEKLKKNFIDVQEMLGDVQQNLVKVQKESALTVKLIEKLSTVQSVENQNENSNQSRSRTRKSK